MFNKKKRHYKDKILITQKKIYDVEFLLSQYKLMREGFRVEYDRIKEELDAINTYKELIQSVGMEKAKELMKNAEKAMEARNEKADYKLNDEEKEVIQTMTNNAKGKEDDIARLKKQMETLDMQMDGPLPAGQTSVRQTIDNLKSVVDMLKDMIKSI